MQHVSSCPLLSLYCLSTMFTSTKVKESMQSDDKFESPISPLETGRENSMEGLLRPGPATHQCNGPITIHLYGPTTLQFHRHPDDVTLLHGITSNSGFAASNIHKIPRKPLSTSRRPGEDVVNTSHKYSPLPSSQPTKENEKQGIPQQQRAGDWNGPDDPDNPESWPLGKKIFHTIVPSAIAFLT